MLNQKGIAMLAVIMLVAFIAVICIAGYFLFVGNNSPAPESQNNQQPVVVDPTANWNVVKDDQLGFEFKYPADFGSKYASFQTTPTVIATPTGSSKIDGQGCYKVDSGGPAKDSQVIIGNMPFCLSQGGDPGAGQLYYTSNYTTLRNGNYFTVQYIVRTPNGCSPYMDTPDYQPCTDFMNQYDTLVTKLINDSVATFKFTK